MFKLSPIGQRRLDQFKANRRGYWSLWVFIGVFLTTLCAEFIANENPLLVAYKGEYYCPIIKSYPETQFGGIFQTEANYRDPEVKRLIKKDGWMLWPLIPYSYNTINYDLKVPAPAPPSADNWLGTDDQGRDLLARLIYGYRVSILFGLILAGVSSFIGVLAGAVQGYFGGTVDLILQRVIEIWGGLPVLYLLIILSSLVEPNFWWLLGIMSLFSWVVLVGVVRAEFFRTRSFDFVRAAEALGVSNFRIMVRHILPNAMIATTTYMPFILSAAITTLTSLDFLGFGLPPGSASLGEIVSQGKNNIQAPWLGFTAFFSIAILLALLIFVGEAVRDAFDSRKVVLE